MAGLTQGKLPYPTGTDKVRDGDDAMKALAEAADNISLMGWRTQDDEVATSSWGSMASAIGPMPAGKYLVTANALWRASTLNQGVYTWLDATMNGQSVVPSRAFGGWQIGDNPINTTLMNVLTFAGGTMSMNMQFGFSDRPISACRGSSIIAVRLGPA